MNIFFFEYLLLAKKESNLKKKKDAGRAIEKLCVFFMVWMCALKKNQIQRKREKRIIIIIWIERRILEAKI